MAYDFEIVSKVLAEPHNGCSIAEGYIVAQGADAAFEHAIRADGHKSRWDWKHDVASANLWLAYADKVRADHHLHLAWAKSRGEA